MGILLKSIDEVDLVDVTVDGADEVDPNFNGIKGGGGALMEKVVGHRQMLHLGSADARVNWLRS